MGFNEAKGKIVECLETGDFRHEERNDIDIKNLLATGKVTTREVLKIILRAKGVSYGCSGHHFDDTVLVHLIETNFEGKRWYIKWYVLEPNVWFISVHN